MDDVVVPIGLMLLFSYGRPWRLTALVASCVISPWILWMLIGSNGDTNPVSVYYTDYVGWWISSGMSDIGVVILINTLFALLSIATSGLGFFDTDFFFPAGLRHGLPFAQWRVPLRRSRYHRG